MPALTDFVATAFTATSIACVVLAPRNVAHPPIHPAGGAEFDLLVDAPHRCGPTASVPPFPQPMLQLLLPPTEAPNDPAGSPFCGPSQKERKKDCLFSQQQHI